MNDGITPRDNSNFLTDKNFSKREKFLFLTIISFLSVICYVYMFRTYMFNTSVSYQDLAVQREFCAYVLRGFDPYFYRGAEAAPAPGLGLIWNGFHATPWGSLLGNLFYPGYLNYEQSRTYFIIVSSIILFLVSYMLYRETKKISKDLAIFAFIISITSIDFLISVHMGNAGFAISSLIIISCLLCDEHPYLSGISLGIAMIKPQAALLFCFAFLMMKKFLPLFIAAVIDIIAWLGTSLLVNKGMLELLREFFISPEHAGMPNAGLFSLCFKNQYHSLILSMISGVIFVILIYKLLHRAIPEYFKFFPVCIASSFWCYSYVYDKYIHIIPAIVCIYIVMTAQKISKKFLFFIFTLYCMYSSIIRSVIRRALAMFFNIPVDNFNPLSTQLPNTLYELGFIVLGIFITIELRKIYREAN